MTPEIQTFLLAMTPFGELRLSIPIAVAVYNLNWGLAYLISVIGNLVPVALFLLFLGPVSGWLSKNFKMFERFFTWLFEKTKGKYNSKMEKAGFFALAVFVAVPLPITGGWTGSLIAFLFGMPFNKAFSSIALGVITAGLIVSLMTKTGMTIEKYFGWQVLIGILLVIGFIWLLFKIKRKKKNYI